ncbi:hypothetical protein LINPERPRIM_LOCUS16099 [Linum perenne]
MNMNSTAAGMNLDMYHSLIFSGGDYWGFDRFVSKSEISDDQLQGGDGGIDEDDLLYAELSRQVLLLTADDDEEEQKDCFLMEKYGGVGGSYINGVGGGNGNLMMMNSANNRIGNLSLGCGNQYFNWPAAAGNSWGNSVNTGTGVFIPYVANSKRRNRRGKKNGKNRGSKVATESKQQW